MLVLGRRRHEGITIYLPQGRQAHVAIAALRDCEAMVAVCVPSTIKSVIITLADGRTVDITIPVVTRDNVRVGIEAPKELTILRDELI